MRVNQNMRVIRRVLQRIVNDIGEKLAQTLTIALNIEIRRHMHLNLVVMRGVGNLQRLDHLVQKIGHREGLHVQAGSTRLHARQIQKEGNKVRKAVSLRDDDLKISRARLNNTVSHILRLRLHHCHRSAQLMRNVGNHVLTHLVRVLQLFAHTVETDGKLTHFIGARRLNTSVIVALSHILCSIANLSERVREVTGKIMADDGENDHHDRQGNPA